MSFHFCYLNSWFSERIFKRNENSIAHSLWTISLFVMKSKFSLFYFFRIYWWFSFKFEFLIRSLSIRCNYILWNDCSMNRNMQFSTFHLFSIWMNEWIERNSFSYELKRVYLVFLVSSVEVCLNWLYHVSYFLETY